MTELYKGIKLLDGKVIMETEGNEVVEISDYIGMIS